MGMRRASQADLKVFRPLFAHSRRDGFLLMVSAAQIALIVWGALNFSALSVPWIVALFVALTFLSVTHHDVVTHSFIHTPFFSSRRLNSLYAVISSVFVMQPSTLMGLEHLAHHRHGNDAIDPATGTTKDATSTYRYGKNGDHEPFWRYSLMSPLREWADAHESYRTAVRSHARRQIGIAQPS